MINYATLPTVITTAPQIRKDRVGRDEKTGKTVRKEVSGVIASRGPISAWGEDEARAKANLAEKIAVEAPRSHGQFQFTNRSFPGRPFVDAETLKYLSRPERSY